MTDHIPALVKQVTLVMDFLVTILMSVIWQIQMVALTILSALIPMDLTNASVNQDSLASHYLHAKISMNALLIVTIAVYKQTVLIRSVLINVDVNQAIMVMEKIALL